MTDQLWTLDEAAAFLHQRPSTVARWVRVKGLPAYRVGHRLLFDPGEVKAWVKGTVQNGTQSP